MYTIIAPIINSLVDAFLSPDEQDGVITVPIVPKMAKGLLGLHKAFYDIPLDEPVIPKEPEITIVSLADLATMPRPVRAMTIAPQGTVRFVPEEDLDELANAITESSCLFGRPGNLGYTEVVLQGKPGSQIGRALPDAVWALDTNGELYVAFHDDRPDDQEPRQTMELSVILKQVAQAD